MITILADRSRSQTTHIPIPTTLLVPTNSGTRGISGKIGHSGMIGKIPPH
jgi:hypothetical protein